jgi:hypothetical protein
MTYYGDEDDDSYDDPPDDDDICTQCGVRQAEHFCEICQRTTCVECLCECDGEPNED